MSARPVRLFHGGRPSMRVGEVITSDLGGRPQLDGCPICAQRAAQSVGGERPDIDALPAHPDRVYATPSRLYARHYASLWGRGWLYGVTPTGPVERSSEDSIETYHAPGWRVVSVLERAVLLTWSERRRLWREWEAADQSAGWAVTGPDT